MSTQRTDLAISQPNSEWRTAKFGDCARLVADRVSPQTAGDTPYIGLEHIGESTLSLIGHGTAQDVTSTKTLFKRKDILFGKLRPYFRKVIAAPFDGICSTDIWVVRPKEGVDAGFLFYTMATLAFVERAVRGSNGTRMPRASWDFLSEYELSLPPLPTQRAISRVLGAFDDKIALNAKMNATLEAMARALFRSWFVDFEPVRAKQSGRWRRGETLPGMPAELYDLFPAELTPTELGDAPAGWEARTIGDCYYLTMGQAPPGKTYNEDGDGMPFFQGRADFGFRYPTNRKFCAAPKRTAHPDDTLVSVRAPIGSLNMAYDECCIGRGVAALRHKSGSSAFTYYSVWSVQWELQRYEQTGTVFGAVTKKQFEAIPILEPPIEVINAFGEFAQQWDKRIRLNTAESRNLAAMRDTLLPRLLSGEVKVE